MIESSVSVALPAPLTAVASMVRVWSTSLSGFGVTFTVPSTDSSSEKFAVTTLKIGRASCRERVSVRVDLGGRSIIKTKSNLTHEQRINNTTTNSTTARQQ